MIDSIIAFAMASAILAVLIGAALWTDAAIRGWRRLADRFAETENVVAGPRQDGNVGGHGIIQLRSLLHARVSDRGLHLAAAPPLRLTHRSLLIPWDQITVREARRLVGVPVVTLSIGRVHAGFVSLRGGVAGEVLERIGVLLDQGPGMA